MRPLPNWPYPFWIAHRGGGRLAPENTLAAMRTAARLDYCMVEFDAKLSRDNHVILLHDDTLARTTGDARPAAQVDYLDLARLDAGAWFASEFAGEPVPLLEWIAHHNLANGIACNIEIKPCPGRETETGTLVAREALRLWDGATPPPLLSSFAEAALEAARTEAPTLPRALLLENLPADWRLRAARLECIAIHLDAQWLDARVIADIHAAGLRAVAWTVNDPEQARALARWGVDGIVTDALDSMAVQQA